MADVDKFTCLAPPPATDAQLPSHERSEAELLQAVYLSAEKFLQRLAKMEFPPSLKETLEPLTEVVAWRAGAFTIEAVLARTPASRLYRARDAHGNTVALKELLFTQVPTVEELEAFEREGRVLEQLHHPAIPRFVASFREGAGVNLRFYLAQELVEGETLASRLRTHRFSEDELLELARQVLEVSINVFARQL